MAEQHYKEHSVTFPRVTARNYSLRYLFNVQEFEFFLSVLHFLNCKNKWSLVNVKSKEGRDIRPKYRMLAVSEEPTKKYSLKYTFFNLPSMY